MFELRANPARENWRQSRLEGAGKAETFLMTPKRPEIDVKGRVAVYRLLLMPSHICTMAIDQNVRYEGAEVWCAKVQNRKSIEAHHHLHREEGRDTSLAAGNSFRNCSVQEFFCSGIFWFRNALVRAEQSLLGSAI
jgi:hypothetical protein